jgi:uncharacterized RDD family membrane protein YckC
MNEPPDKKALSSAPKEEALKSIIVPKREKNFIQRIENLLRSETGGVSPTILFKEQERGFEATDQEKARWNKEFDRLNRSLEFHTDFGLKVVVFFYGTVGVVLSIFFGKGGESRGASLVLLGIPIIISWILCYYFFYGALIWDKDADYMRRLAARLGFEELTKIELLSKILRAFGGLFFITGIFLIGLLIWFLTRVD